jgi:SNF2 family DNA or RNA helicase
MNNIKELWALLNFLMPQLFSSQDDFDSWFNFDLNTNNSQTEMSQEDKMMIISCLHRVMKPFILRRTKKDLLTKLPDKIEINVSISMS